MNKTLDQVAADLQAIDKTELDQVVAAVDQAVVDIQAIIAAGVPVESADPIATAVITTKGGVVTNMVVAASDTDTNA